MLVRGCHQHTLLNRGARRDLGSQLCAFDCWSAAKVYNDTHYRLHSAPISSVLGRERKVQETMLKDSSSQQDHVTIKCPQLHYIRLNPAVARNTNLISLRERTKCTRNYVERQLTLQKGSGARSSVIKRVESLTCIFTLPRLQVAAMLLSMTESMHNLYTGLISWYWAPSLKLSYRGSSGSHIGRSWTDSASPASALQCASLNPDRRSANFIMSSKIWLRYLVIKRVYRSVSTFTRICKKDEQCKLLLSTRHKTLVSPVSTSIRLNICSSTDELKDHWNQRHECRNFSGNDAWRMLDHESCELLTLGTSLMCHIIMNVFSFRIGSNSALEYQCFQSTKLTLLELAELSRI